MIVQFHTVSKEKLQTHEKLVGIGVLNTKGRILKKINVSFNVHYCLGKYGFSLNTYYHIRHCKFFTPALPESL